MSNSTTPKTIILTGGGTAGHVMPNIALLDTLKTRFDKIVYIGSKNGIEKEIIEKYQFVDYRPITTVKFIRGLTAKNLLLPFKLIKGVQEARKIIKEVNPSIIFSKGGFVAVPVALASGKIPLIAHESDMTLGLANKIIYKKCKYMCTNFEKTAKNLKKGIYTSSPLRNLKGNKHNLSLTLDPYKKTLLVMGGSLGAKAINSALRAIINKVCNKLNVIHLVGKGNLSKNNNYPKNYNQIEFTNNIEDVFDATDYVVSRAGANAITELLTLNLPMLLIPLPKGNSRGDQIENALYFKEKGYANLLFQEDITNDRLLNEIDNLITNASTLKQNQKCNLPNGTKAVSELIFKNML